MSKILKGSINLEAFQAVRIKTKQGNPAIVIPVNENLVAGDKGVYANVSVFINDEEDQYGNIASIKQDKPVKGKWSDMTEQEKEDHKKAQKDMPYLGNLKEMQFEKSDGFENVQESEPEKDDNLPF